MPPAWTSAPDIVLFAGEGAIELGHAEPHGLVDAARQVFGRTREEVRADWERVVAQIRFLLERVDSAVDDFELDEVKFELGFSAEGRIVFVAKGGITTTISATFRRRSTVNEGGG